MDPIFIDQVAHIASFMPEWLKPRVILEDWGFWALLAILFAETGLLVGFFLPGDTLLFSAGLLAHPDFDGMGSPFWLLLLCAPIAAILGNLVGYGIGQTIGPKLFAKEDSWIFRKERLDKSRSFFEKHGPVAVFIARWVPIIRTFLPVVAGAARMDKRVFFIWSVIGGVVWTCGLMILGYLLVELLSKDQAEWVAHRIDFLIIGVVAIAVVGMIAEPILHKRKAAKHN